MYVYIIINFILLQHHYAAVCKSLACRQCLFHSCFHPYFCPLDSDEALKLRVKIAYRRARAYLHTEEYVFALNDAAYCHMYNIDNDDSITSLFREVSAVYLLSACCMHYQNCSKE